MDSIRNPLVFTLVATYNPHQYERETTAPSQLLQFAPKPYCYSSSPDDDVEDDGEDDWSGGGPPANTTLSTRKGRRLTLLEIVLCNSGTAAVSSRSLSGSEEQREPP